MRREIPARVKVAAYERCKGACECCGGPLHVGKFHYDHIIPDALGGSPDLENVQVLCRPCHDAKTHGEDVPRIAKARRQQRRHIGAETSRHPLPGGRKSRWKKKLNGEVVER